MPRVLKMNDEDLTKEVLDFIAMPRLDVDGKTFLLIDECQPLMGSRASLADELKDLEKLRGEFKQNYSDLAEKEKRDRKLVTAVNWTKARKVYRCDECTAPRYLFLTTCMAITKIPRSNLTLFRGM